MPDADRVKATAFALVVLGCLTTAVIRPRKGPLDPSKFVRVSFDTRAACSTQYSAMKRCEQSSPSVRRRPPGGGGAGPAPVTQQCREEAAKRVRERCIDLLTDYELCKQDGEDDCSSERDAYQACEQAAQHQGA